MDAINHRLLLSFKKIGLYYDKGDYENVGLRTDAIYDYEVEVGFSVPLLAAAEIQYILLGLPDVYDVGPEYLNDDDAIGVYVQNPAEHLSECKSVAVYINDGREQVPLIGGEFLDVTGALIFPPILFHLQWVSPSLQYSHFTPEQLVDKFRGKEVASELELLCQLVDSGKTSQNTQRK